MCAAATPVIMLTGNEKMQSKREGFELGADQYLIKPVAPQELLLWIQALLRRVSMDKEEGEPLCVGELSVDLDARVVRYGETAVLHLARKEILSKLWRTVVVDRVVDFHVFNLRKKLPPDAAAKTQTVPGKGFRFFG